MDADGKFGEIHQFPAPLRNAIVARLRAAIISGSLKPGDRLIEAQLVKELKISRPSLREAMRQIEAEGLIEIVANVGPIVREPSSDEIKEIYDLREVVEGVCARYFAIRGSDAAMDRLRHAATMIEAALAKADVNEIKRAKQAYYEAFTSGCGSALIGKHVLQLVAMTSYIWGSSLGTPGRPAEGINEMRRLVEAICGRNPEHAAAASQTHIRHAAMTSLAIQAGLEPKGDTKAVSPGRSRASKRRTFPTT